MIDRHEVKSLIERAKSVDTKFNSFFIEEEAFEETSDRFLGEIVEDIEIKDLVLYPHSTIIYNKANLKEEFELVLATYKYVPKVVYNEMNCMRILIRSHRGIG